LELAEAVRSRQSVNRVKQDPVPDELIEAILESAVHAPNHKITEPWLFHVFTGKGRGELARARAETARLQAEEEGEGEEMAAGRISRERKKAFRAPGGDSRGRALGARRGRDEGELRRLLGRRPEHAPDRPLLGLGAIWRTGPVAYHRHMRDFFGLQGDDSIVAYIYLGYPDMGERPRRRGAVSERTAWHRG
jgi:nitroreductase